MALFAATGLLVGCTSCGGGFNVPVIVRLNGTNAEAKEILSNSDVSVIAASGMKDAAEKAVKAIKN